MPSSSNKIHCDTLVNADVVVTQNDTRSVIYDAGIAILDGTILEVGSYDSLKKNFTAQSSLDLSGKAILPGLINAHTHLPMTLLRGVADDLPLMEWLEDHIWPIESQLSDEMLEIGAMIGLAELIKTGCTAFLNGYFHEHITGDCAQKIGLRAVLGEGFFNFPSPHFPTSADCWKTNRKLVDRFTHSKLIRTAITPHAVFTVQPKFLVESFQLAEELGVPWQIHLAESEKETAACLSQHGKRPVELLNDLQLLTPRTTLHHCVDVTHEEIEILANSRVNIVHNPASNMKLCSGIAPIQAMLNANITVGLGTDGAASNNQLNMFREMGLAALIGKIRNNSASSTTANSVLDMATRGSSACLGWPQLGRIEPGCPADIVALDLSAPNMQPMFNPISQIVYATTGGEVSMTMVNGIVLYKDGEHKTLDNSALNEAAKSARDWVFSKATSK